MGGRSAGLPRSGDNLRNHALACPRTGLLARRGFLLERAWIQVVREAIGPEGTAVAGQHHGTRGRSRRSATARFCHIWCCRTRRSHVLRCNTCVTCPTRWQPPSGSACAGWGRTGDGTAPQAGTGTIPRAHSREPPSPVCVLAAEVGGRWDDESQRLVQRLVAMSARRGPGARPHRDGRGAGVVPWRLRSSERHAAPSSESGQCRRCRQAKTTCRAESRRVKKQTKKTGNPLHK